MPGVRVGVAFYQEGMHGVDAGWLRTVTCFIKKCVRAVLVDLVLITKYTLLLLRLPEASMTCFLSLYTADGSGPTGWNPLNLPPIGLIGSDSVTKHVSQNFTSTDVSTG